VRVTCLIENTAISEEYAFEHGLSLYIETEHHKILFDMGQTDLFQKNAVRLGIDLSLADVCVLSHGHYDHGGGMKTFLEINPHAPIYLSRYAFEPHYNGTDRYIGLDTALQNSDRLIFHEDQLKIADGITLYHCNQNPTKHALGNERLYMLQDGRFLTDDLRHEQYLLMEEKGKRILFSGCSHKGILNIMEWFQPDVLIGGFHMLMKPLDAALEQYAKKLDAYHTEYYTCHCTGKEQYHYMKQYMKHLHVLSAGQHLVI